MRPAIMISLIIPLTAFSLAAAPQSDSRSAGNRSQQRLGQSIYRELVMLPQYDVFDNLGYRINGDSVELFGQVTKPNLKAEAERAVEGIEGVSKVVNNIEVLPPSDSDDRIRMAVYRALFSNSSLERYAMQAVPPIHIIVKNGRVSLEGVVSSQADKDLANLLASQVPGIFSVTNNLRVED